MMMTGFYLQIDSISPVAIIIVVVLVFSVLYLLLFQSLRTKRRIALDSLKSKIFYGVLKNQDCLREIKFNNKSNNKNVQSLVDFKFFVDNEINLYASNKLNNLLSDFLRITARLIDTKEFREISNNYQDRDKIRYALNYSFYSMLKKKYLEKNTATDLKIDRFRTQQIQLLNKEIDLIEFKTNELIGQICK